MSKKLPIVAIVGRANVGKSSLFNAILERREAIVAREAGTTRDSLWAVADYKGQNFWLVDTAGMKDAEDDFEFTIQEQITQAADSADVIWVVIEADVLITEEDRRVAKMALKTRKPVFLVVNKADKAPKATPDEYQRLGIKPILLTSAMQNRGIDTLLEALLAGIPKVTDVVDDNRLHLSLLGRPNVGKSYLFNTLAKKQQAIVADRAGTTRDINRAVVRYEGREVEIMDTAGIRRSGKIETGIEQFSVIRSIAAIEQSDVCLLLMDANELHVQLDQKIAGMIKEAGKGLILVISKWDTFEDKTPFSRDQLAAELKHTYDFVPWAPLILTSSVTGQNVTRIFDLVLQIVKARETTIKTTDLNRWLRQIVDDHPPAGLKNRQPKLNYIIQETDNPTNFKVYGSQTKFLHWSYKRYMEREFRQKYGFEGTPIRFWFFEKHESHRHGVSPTRADQKHNSRSGLRKPAPPKTSDTY
jgi:GTP-binding protein